MEAQMRLTDAQVMEQVEFVGRTMKELIRLLRDGGGYVEVTDEITRARSALDIIRMAIWQRQLRRAVDPDHRRASQDVR
jgi:hypothetical protein